MRSYLAFATRIEFVPNGANEGEAPSALTLSVIWAARPYMLL